MYANDSDDYDDGGDVDSVDKPDRWVMTRRALRYLVIILLPLSLSDSISDRLWLRIHCFIYLLRGDRCSW